MSIPAVSVIMGAYNAEKYLHSAIESILNQSFHDFEFIIIDDGSKDDTGKIIDEYAAQDKRIVVIHHENIGHANSLNKALNLAKAPLIARMDADDIALPQRFEKQVEFLNAHPDIAVLGTSIRLIDGNDQFIRDVIYISSEKEIAELVLQGSPVAHPTVMMRKDVVMEMKGYRPVFDPAEDYDLWLRISEKYQIANLPEVYLLYRQHDNNLSFKYSQYQTLCTFVLQMASKVRRNNLPDPLENIGRITAETLKLFHLNRADKRELLYKTYNNSLYRFVENQDEQGIAELLKTIENDCEKEDSKEIKYRICISLFQNYYNLGRYTKAYGYLLRMFFYAPVAVSELLIKESIKQMLPTAVKRQLKKLLRKVL